MRNVDYLVVDNVKNLCVNTRYIGRGTTANCYKTKDDRVLKVFRETYRKQSLFNFIGDMESHYNKISMLNNDSYVGPQELVLSKLNKIVAYYMEYKNARTIKRFKLNIRVRDLIEPYKRLIIDTKKVSEARFRVSDLHNKNILYDGSFYMIDLDHGKFDDFHECSDILKYNMCDIVHVIIDAIFGASYDKDIYFVNSYLDDLYEELTRNNYELFEEFISKLEEVLNVENPTIGYLRRKRGRILTLQKRVDYYGRY